MPTDSVHSKIFFSLLVTFTQQEKILLITDEYPYLQSAYPAIAGILQKHIDHGFRETSTYRTILHLLAAGVTSVSKIADKSGFTKKLEEKVLGKENIHLNRRGNAA